MPRGLKQTRRVRPLPSLPARAGRDRRGRSPPAPAGSASGGGEPPAARAMAGRNPGTELGKERRPTRRAGAPARCGAPTAREPWRRAQSLLLREGLLAAQPWCEGFPRRQTGDRCSGRAARPGSGRESAGERPGR